MDELKADLKQVGRYLLSLAGEVTETRIELKRLDARFESMETTVQGLQGTFASIEVHLVKLFEEEAATRSRLDRLESRMEALENQRPPAA
jgi:chromosome segregation ATPase